MELRQLRYFVEVAEREHVTDASLHLHVAQSAVSYQIAKLEEELGVRLFERTGRNVKLTRIGEVFLFHVKQALAAIDEAKAKIAEYLDPEHGTIRVGYASSFANYILPTVLSSFAAEHPEISFHLRHGSYYGLIDEVKNGEINLAFLGPVPDDENLESHVLFAENFAALLPVRHPLAEQTGIYLNELQNDPFVLFPKGYVFRQIVIDACKQAGFMPKIASEGEDMDAVKGLVSAGIGVTLLPENSLYENVPRLTKKVPVLFPEVRRSVGIITPKNRELSPAENAFRQFTIRFFSQLEKF